MPPGSHTISSTTATPKNTRYHFCMNFSHSTLRRAQPLGQQDDDDRADHRPEEAPDPPTITASSIMSDVEKWNGPGSMNSTSDAK